MTNVNLRVAPHLLARTIGGQKSSHGVVNNHELFILYSMVKRVKIDVGLEVAKFLYRQASDPRAHGIFCGGYITKLLKSMHKFQAPLNDKGTPSPKIRDGPFASWNLVKLVDLPTPSRYTTPPRDIPSTSRTPPPVTDLHQLVQEFREERELNRKERKKNKKFRAVVWRFLGRLATCFSPPPTDLPDYQSSPDPPSPVHTTPRRAGKSPAHHSSSGGSAASTDEQEDDPPTESQATESPDDSADDDDDEDEEAADSAHSD